MPIVHIVLFEFKPVVERKVIQDVSQTLAIAWLYRVPLWMKLTDGQVCKRMLALQDQCVHPTSKKPYVKSHGGGRDNSPEGHQVVATLIPLIQVA